MLTTKGLLGPHLLGDSAQLLGAPFLLGGICDTWDAAYDATLCTDTGAGACASGCVVTETGAIVPASSSQGKAIVDAGGTIFTAANVGAAIGVAAQALCAFTGNCAHGNVPPPGWNPYASGEPWYTTTGGMLGIGAALAAILYVALK